VNKSEQLDQCPPWLNHGGYHSL